MAHLTSDDLRTYVRENYGHIAKAGNPGCGCAPSCCKDSPTTPSADEVSLALGYSRQDVSKIPNGANMGLGCGNPQAIASLQVGEMVLDLGSGGGFDCFLAANAVGKTGQVIGVDMTPEMVSKARRNAEQADYANVEFRLGEIEHLPVADESIDVILSNCVINLSPEKTQVFREAFRVLKPGGRLAIVDVVATAELPQATQQDLRLYTGCIGGTSSITHLETMLQGVGFQHIRIQSKDDSQSFLRKRIQESRMEDYIISATIEAVKPTTH